MLSNKKSVLFYFLGFFVFIGFYVIILALANVGLLTLSRLITIPIRLLISLAFLLILIFSRHVILKRQTILFLLFAVIYLLRVLIDFLNGESLYMGYGELIFYFLSFAVLPFVCTTATNLNLESFDAIRKALFFSSILFVIIAVPYLYQYIGTVSRFGSNTIGGEAISPLILSYCSSLIIGVTMVYLMTNKVSGKNKAMLLILIFLSTIPFFMGASRGGLVALFTPFIFMYGFKRGAMAKMKFVVFAVIGLSVLVFLAQEMGSGVFNRMGNISEDIANEDSSAIRIFIWIQSLSQFLSSPLFGDKLAVDGFSGYPHNLIIEALQATGIIGLIPFAILFIMSFKRSVFIFRNFPKHAWLSVIFIQCFTQSMFSGAIYSSGWLWFSMALILSFPLQNKKNKTIIIPN